MLLLKKQWERQDLENGKQTGKPPVGPGQTS